MFIDKIDEKYITEWKSVNDDVLSVSRQVRDEIVKDVAKREKTLSQIENVLYAENGVGFPMQITFNDTKNVNIKVKYVIYFVMDEYEEMFLSRNRNVNLNCEWDNENGTLTIVGIFKDGEPTDSFTEDISHEVEHMFEYTMGLKKREDLYGNVVNMLKGTSDLSYYVAVATYYTFPHEQNAFKQQFYEFLLNQKSLLTYEQTLQKFQPWKSVNNIYDAVYDNYDDEVVMSAINKLGYTRRNFFKRLYFGLKRFEKKLANVYLRWKTENKDKFLTNESIIKNRIIEISNKFALSEGKTFDEKYINLPKCDFEFIFYSQPIIRHI